MDEESGGHKLTFVVEDCQTLEDRSRKQKYDKMLRSLGHVDARQTLHERTSQLLQRHGSANQK